ncbi:uncharacterized protein ASPGLDRAFT_1192597 [Aspergillus glaucus CBS 516.65]|uniref:Uncharacterized protein n=1 Tax=Aspergillus glaucus CBS 516.65 TaxID=1160497 RepID=A0A1L9V4A1_ASPGL|nr:hypothetical protein ASPGLDRAFT_1192597 [Aspergillus glaucus CBS 516.65]OJJ78758.1 hypothetical protein ASPGLDRAFT_1192597 [Aspergillus glaucus CBS 516.65]
MKYTVTNSVVPGKCTEDSHLSCRPTITICRSESQHEGRTALGNRRKDCLRDKKRNGRNCYHRLCSYIHCIPLYQVYENQKPYSMFYFSANKRRPKLRGRQ